MGSSRRSRSRREASPRAPRARSSSAGGAPESGMTLVLDDTIAALATAPGAAGLAVIRVSGPSAVAVAAAVFDGPRLSAAASHTLHHGWVVWPEGGAGGNGHAPGARLDEVVAALFRAPRSYTREDVVELSCHGGEQPTRAVLAAL